ncbi:MAG: zinc ribbon domain-containing protein [bacterium]|nr:zinc ribbon domain-containing protein [bacterium]
MIFIGGYQPKTVRLAKAVQACPHCAQYDVYQKRIDHYISLFFIPVLRMKKGSPFTACENCGAHFQDKDIRSGSVAGGDTGASIDNYCPSCRVVLEPQFSFCPHCGKEVE